MEKTKLKKISLGQTSEASFALIGILGPVKSYVLAHHLNRLFEYQLCRDEDDILYPQKEFDTFHLCYRYMEPDYHHRIYLIGNKGGGSLVPERKEYDYILVYKGDHLPEDFTHLVKKIRTIESVQYAEFLKSKQLKSLLNHPITFLP